jgi:hypothetical protein
LGSKACGVVDDQARLWENVANLRRVDRIARVLRVLGVLAPPAHGIKFAQDPSLGSAAELRTCDARTAM